MNKRSLLFESSKALKNSILYSITLSIIMPFILWIWKPDFRIPLWLGMVVLTILLLLISLLSTAVYLLMDLYNKEKNKRMNYPKIVNVKKDILILTPSNLYEYNIIVTILYIDIDESETFVGVGQVLNIQGNGLIQVEIKNWDENHNDILEHLKQNNKNILSKILVKPFISKQKLDNLEGGL